LKVVTKILFVLYRRVPSRALPIHLFRHFCCMMYRFSHSA